MLIGSGLQALTTLGKFKPVVLGEIQAAGDTFRPPTARDGESASLERPRAGDRFRQQRLGGMRLVAQPLIASPCRENLIARSAAFDNEISEASLGT
jgi:hypothetical protein